MRKRDTGREIETLRHRKRQTQGDRVRGRETGTHRHRESSNINKCDV